MITASLVVQHVLNVVSYATSFSLVSKLYLRINVTYSFSDAELLQLQYADFKFVFEILVFKLHGPCVRGHILRMRRWAVRACVMQQERSI